MAIPDNLLPHTVTLVRPATITDTYGNTTRDYGAAATRTPIAAWMQQDRRQEARTDGREAAIQDWLMLINHSDVQRLDRVEFGALMFEVEGPPEPTYTPAGVHHTEVTLRVVEG